MARHQADDDAAADPLVEAARRRRTHATGGAHRADLPGQAGPIGWPEPGRDDEGTEPVGWPGDPTGADEEASEV